jgi:hypothetical protein
MLELSGLAAVSNARHRPTHLIHAASGHDWITPVTTTANYHVANLQQFDFLSPRQDEDDGWINERVSGCMDLCA